MAALGFFLPAGRAVVGGFGADLAAGFIVGSLVSDFAVAFGGAFFACAFGFALRCTTFFGAGFVTTTVF
jgi:hypothetical protein